MKIYIKEKEEIYQQKDLMYNYLKGERDRFFKEYIYGKKYFNGLNSRVESVEILGDMAVLNVQKVYYEDYIKTNIFYREEYVKKGRKDAYLKLLSGEFANHLGMSAMVKTKDGKYLITERGKHLVQASGKVSVSYSGAVGGLKTGSLEDNYGNVVYKEATEELGIVEEDFKSVNLVGVEVDEDRGRKLQLYFDTVLNLTEEDLRERMKWAVDSHENSNFWFKTEKELNEGNYGGSLGEMLSYIRNYEEVGQRLEI